MSLCWAKKSLCHTSRHTSAAMWCIHRRKFRGMGGYPPPNISTGGMVHVITPPPPNVDAKYGCFLFLFFLYYQQFQHQCQTNLIHFAIYAKQVNNLRRSSPARFICGRKLQYSLHFFHPPPSQCH